MPEMDGLEFLRRLSEEAPQTAVAIHSALDRALLKSIEVMAAAYGVDLVGVLEKPVTEGALGEVVERALERTSSPKVSRRRRGRGADRHGAQAARVRAVVSTQSPSAQRPGVRRGSARAVVPPACRSAAARPFSGDGPRKRHDALAHARGCSAVGAVLGTVGLAREGFHAVAKRLPDAARRPGVRGRARARAYRCRGYARGSGARDHRKRRLPQSRRGAREPRAFAHARLRALDRRLRHGPFVAREARAHAVLGAQDRSRVRDQAGYGPRGSHVGRIHRSRSPAAWGCARWPKASRRKCSARSCSTSIAIWVRAICSRKPMAAADWLQWMQGRQDSRVGAAES